MAGSQDLDLRRQSDVESWFDSMRPDVVYLSAATAGGIHVNRSRPADFIYNNLAIQNSVIHSSHVYGVEKLCFLGSSCIYPRLAPQPMKEDCLLTGPLDENNIWYAVAKIAGLMTCDGYHRQYGSDFLSVMPANLYGLGDKFTLENSHVVAALLDRFHRSKIEDRNTVGIWGTGKARREFLFADDMADACVFLMERYSSPEIINVGCGYDYTISELADLISQAVGYKGSLSYDVSKPDGMPQKVVDVDKLADLGWRSGTSFETGIAATYEWYLKHVAPSYPSYPTQHDWAVR